MSMRALRGVPSECECASVACLFFMVCYRVIGRQEAHFGCVGAAGKGRGNGYRTEAGTGHDWRG